MDGQLGPVKGNEPLLVPVGPASLPPGPLLALLHATSESAASRVERILVILIVMSASI
jgi:hypothetical protein